MKYSAFFLAIIALCISCSEKDFYDENLASLGSTELNKDFSFQTKSNKNITIYAVDAFNKKTADVPVLIFNENPYDNDGKYKNLFPVAYGVTDKSGKLEIDVCMPNGIKTLFVMPSLPGFGGMQTYDITTNQNVTLQGPQNETAKVFTTTRSEKNYFDIEVQGGFNVHTFYNKGMTGNNGIPFVDNDLVSISPLSTDFLSLISSWYPETQNIQDERYYKLENCTDLLVTGEYGSEIWVTYIGDGGFSAANKNIMNTLCYYHYQDGEASAFTLEDAKNIRKNIVFLNTNQTEIAAGRKVQLLYWDGTEYTKVFPKGVRIGWVMIQEGFNNFSYNKKTLGNLYNYRFSTASLNKAQGVVEENQVIARWNEEYKCNIVGVENRERGHRAWDGDYNDVLFTVIANPVVKPTVDVPVEGEGDATIIESKAYGTLAFEDMYPNRGDWDHNDLVVDYVYGLEQKKKTGKVTAITIDLNVRAVGAQRTSGLGIELPMITRSNATVIGGILEEGNNNATIIAYNNVRDAFGGKTGVINTSNNEVMTEATDGKRSIRISLKQEMDAVNIGAFNPFIFVDNRENEIHLCDFRPTSKGILKTGVSDDKSDGMRTFYRTGEGHAWALDIARVSGDVPGWIYPVENVSIEEAYLFYNDWVIGNGHDTWFDSTISSNVNSDNLYK